MFALALTGAAVTPHGPSNATAGATAAPNVIVIQTDDQDLRTMQAMPRTQELLGDHGTTFSRHLAAHPVCCPSRSTLLTGQHSHNHGVLSNNAATHGGYSFLDHSETLPVWLERAGYATAHVGKYMNGTKKTDWPPGWTEWYTTFRGETERLYGYRMSVNGTVRKYGDAPEDYGTDVFADLGEDFITRRAPDAAPFYLQVDTVAPHAEKLKSGEKGTLERNPRPAPRHFEEFLDAEFEPSPSFNESKVSDKPDFLHRPRMKRKQIDKIEIRYRDRLASLLSVDDLVERLVNAVESAGELDSTLIVFTSDNGYLQGEHRFHRGKRELWEESIRVPLLIRGPGFDPGATYSYTTANIDLARTILRAAGAPSAGHKLDGQPLQKLLDSPQRGRKMLLENGIHGSTGIRTRRWVLLDHEKGRELYDLREDPFQVRSLHKSRQRRYMKKERSLMRQLRPLRHCEGHRQC